LWSGATRGADYEHLYHPDHQTLGGSSILDSGSPPQLSFSWTLSGINWCTWCGIYFGATIYFGIYDDAHDDLMALPLKQSKLCVAFPAPSE